MDLQFTELDSTMTYTLIGIDGQHYGPTTEEEVRRWIAERRLNAQSMVKGENDAAFRPLSTFPEFANALAADAAIPPGMPALAGSIRLEDRDYNLSIGDCIARGWEIVKKNFWPIVGVTLLVAVIMAVINRIVGLFTQAPMNDFIYRHQFSLRGGIILTSSSIIVAPISTVLLAGLFKYFLKLNRGQSPDVADAFSGFGPPLGQLLLLGLVQGILIWIGFIFCMIPGIYLCVAWYFAMPLVIDKGMDFWPAMELSRKMVNKHWFTVFGFLIVYVLLVMAGILACCVGVLVTAAIGMAGFAHAYETIFGEPPQTR